MGDFDLRNALRFRSILFFPSCSDNGGFQSRISLHRSEVSGEFSTDLNFNRLSNRIEIRTEGLVISTGRWQSDNFRAMHNQAGEREERARES